MGTAGDHEVVAGEPMVDGRARGARRQLLAKPLPG
jgi:hypothetical protein